MAIFGQMVSDDLFPTKILRHGDLQSPTKESMHFCQAEYSKLRGARQKVGLRHTHH